MPLISRLSKISTFLKYRLYELENIQAVIVDAMNWPRKLLKNREHIQLAADWLVKAHENASDGGMCRGYYFSKKWTLSHVGCAGYSSETLWAVGKYLNDSKYSQIGLRIAKWLCQHQLSTGAFPKNTIYDTEPRVLSTAEALFGLIEAFEQTKDESFIKHASRAGDWLCEVQEADGSWEKYNFIHKSMIFSYHGKTAYALYRLFQMTRETRYLESSLKNLTWTARFQLVNGFFLHASLNGDRDPQSHLMAYTLRGYTEIGISLKNPVFLGIADKALRRAAELFLALGYLPATVNEQWGRYNGFYRKHVRRSCLCGDAEFSIMWSRMWEATQDPFYRDVHLRMNSFLKDIHGRRYASSNLRGGLPGCDKTYGYYYERFAFTNWTVKFFIDALLAEEKIRHNHIDA